MKLSPRRFTVEEFPEQQSWIGSLLSPINQTIQELFSGLSNNLTIQDNLKQEIKELKFLNDSTNFPLKFKTKFSQNPKGVQTIYCLGTDGTSPTNYPWPVWYYNNGQIQIDSISNLTSGKTYVVRLLVIYE